jgi:hypothetical protein
VGWNTSALFVENRTLEEVLGFLPDVFSYDPTGETVSALEAWAGSPGDRLYGAVSGGWCQIWDPDQRFAPRVERILETDGAGTLEGTRAVALLFSSVTSTYAFWLYQDGALVRHATFESGKCIQEGGEPLAIESQVALPSWGHDEDFLWAVVTAVTGLDADEDQQFGVFSVDV